MSSLAAGWCAERLSAPLRALGAVVLILGATAVVLPLSWIVAFLGSWFLAWLAATALLRLLIWDREGGYPAKGPGSSNNDRRVPRRRLLPPV